MYKRNLSIGANLNLCSREFKILFIVSQYISSFLELYSNSINFVSGFILENEKTLVQFEFIITYIYIYLYNNTYTMLKIIKRWNTVLFQTLKTLAIYYLLHLRD